MKRTIFIVLVVISAGLTFGSPVSASRADPTVPNSTPNATPSAIPTSTPSSAPSVGPELHVRGQALAHGGGYFVFTTGDALRLRDDTQVPKGLSIGSVVSVTLDRAERQVTAIALDPPPTTPNEIDISALPREYIVVSAKSAPRPTPAGQTALSAASSGLATVTIDVHVPANTPVGDDVYLSTDRSTYSPAEVRMQRADARRFTITLGLPANTILKYQFTRGTYQSVERDRTGGIAPPHQLTIAPNAKADDTVVRWADIS